MKSIAVTSDVTAPDVKYATKKQSVETGAKMGYQNGGRWYFYRAGSCVFLLFLLVISLTTFLHPASRSEERAPEASLQRGVASARYDNLSFGISGKADCIVDREGFALGYIEYHEQPAWVIYKLTRTEVQAKVAKRTNRFREDPEIPTGSATNADYRKSGYDRGHLAPAADMAFSVQTIADSFFFSNMSPQVPAFNRGIWKRLEEQVRKFALQEGEIMVVTGPVLPKEKSITIGNNKVTVPDRYYKVVYDLTPPQKMIGFIIPNSGSTRPLQDFAVTVDAIEKETGLDFFSLVSRQEQDRLESTITLDAWSW